MLSVHEASLCKDQITACVNFKCAKQTYSLSANILNQQQQPVETNLMSSTTSSSSSYHQQQQNPHIGDNNNKSKTTTTTNNHNNTSVDDNNNISHLTTTTGPLTTSNSLATTTKTLNNYMSTVNGRPRSMDFSKYFQVGCKYKHKTLTFFSSTIIFSKHLCFSLIKQQRLICPNRLQTCTGMFLVFF